MAALWIEVVLRAIFLGFVPLIVMIGLVGGAAAAAAQGRPALVEVDQVRTEPMARTVPVLGRVVARQGGPIATRVAGAVAEVAVEVGDRVAAGALLARLVDDRRRFERELAAAELAAADAQRGTAAAELALRRQEHRRLRRLKGSAAFSRARLDDKAQEIVVSEGRLTEAAQRAGMARARLGLADWDLEHTGIRAPYAGVVGIRHVSAGAYVQVGAPIVTLIDDTGLELEADVPSDRVAGLTPGTAVAVTLDDGSAHSAEVRAVVPRENPLTRTRAVRFTPRFGAMGKPIAVEQSATLKLPVGRPRDVVTVHKDAVTKAQGKALVYLVVDGKAERRTVRLGTAVGGRFEVLDGLEPGDVVVIRGNERLRPGQSVRPKGGDAGAKRGNGAKKEPS